MYFCYINFYLNYDNIDWASANPTKLDKVYHLLKLATGIVFNGD